MNPKISIIIPLFNKEKYIRRCIESLQHQSLQDFEIIIIDDCSSDISMQIVEDIANSDNRIKSLYHEKNQGPMKARETGYKNANGEYFVFVDGDDTLPEDALEILYTEIIQSDADIVMAGFQYINTKKTLKKPTEYPLVIGEYSSVEIFHYLLNRKLRHNLCFCIFNSELFKHDYVCFPNQTNAEDMILFYELVGNSKKVKTINKIVYNYHLEGSSSTRSVMTSDKIKQLIVAQNFRFNYLSKQGIPINDIMKYIANVYVALMRYKIFNELSSGLEYKIIHNLKFPNILRFLSKPNIIKYILLRIKLGIAR